MPAFGYVRKSVFHGDQATADLNMQRDAIAALAARFNVQLEPANVLEELDISGRKGRDQRPRWNEILTAIESGDATHVFAYSLSRFTRSLKDLAAFKDLCTERGVTFATMKENVDTSTAMGSAMLSMIGVINELESELASERQKDKVKADRAAGKYRGGGRKYGEIRDVIINRETGETRMVGADDDPQAVIAAYRETRSFFRAAERLNAAGLPTRNAKSKGWSPSAVRSIVGHHAPDLIRETRIEDRPIRGGRTIKRAARFARVLRCSVCDAYLTPSVDTRTGATRYYCHAYTAKGHARKTVMESAIIRAIVPAMEETAIRMKRITKGAHGGAVIDVDALNAKRERFIDMYGEGLISKVRRDDVIREVEADLQRAASARRVRRYTLPPDPTGDPAKVNAWMRDTFERIVVDMATPGKRGVSTDVAITPEWLNGLRAEVAAQG